MRSVTKVGLGAGALASVALAWFGVLLRTDRPMLGHPLRYVAGVSQITVAYLIIGSGLGLVLSVLVHAAVGRRRGDSDKERPDGPGAALPLSTGASLLVFSAYYYGVRHADASSPSAVNTWLLLTGLSLVALGGWSIVRRSVPEPGVGPLLAWGASVLAGVLGLFGGARAIAGKIERTGLPSAWLLIYLVALAVGVAAACSAGLLVRTLMGRLSRRGSPQASAYIVLGTLAGLLVILAATGLGLGTSANAGRLPHEGRPAAGQGSGSGPSVILISVDALRADFVGYSGGPVKTPNVDRLAEESHVFTHAYSVAPWTTPSFAAFFSGHYPSEMGVGRVRRADDDATPHTTYQWIWRTDRKLLAELFRDEGYATVAVVTNGHLTREAHADQGFDVFHHCSHGWRTRSSARMALSLAGALLGNVLPTNDDLERGEVVTTRATGIIAQPLGTQPTLLWLHYMDPHAPYDPPGIPEDRKVRLDYDDKSRMAAGRNRRTAVGREKCVAAYAGEVEYWDKWLGRLRDGLEARGLWDSSIVVLWSDHGEEFWEHDSFEHGQSLYNELLHIPLIVRLPGQKTGRRIDQPVSLLDVLPTLVELCDLEPPEGLSGRSLAPVLSETPGSLEAFKVYAETCSYGSIRKGLLNDRYKLIYDLSKDSFSLYDLREDPGERHDIFGTGLAPGTEAMERELRDWSEQTLAMMDEHLRKAGADQVSPAARKQLRDMGYAQ